MKRSIFENEAILATPATRLSSLAVSREAEQAKNGVTPRNIRNFILDPPDKVQVMSWFERRGL